MQYKNKLIRNTILCYLPIVILFALIRMLSAFGLLNFLGEWGDYVLTIVIQIGLLFTISIFVFSKLNKTKPKDTFNFFGYRKINWKGVLLAIAIGVVVYLLNVFITTFFNAFLSALGYQFSSGSAVTSYPVWLLFINLLMTAVLPGICEETAHRGLLLKGLSPLGRKTAIILSALLFGLLHLNIEQFFYATLIGLLLGYITTISENIIPAMIIHFMNNAMSVVMGFSSFHKLGLEIGFNYINSWLQSSPLLGMLFVILLIAGLGYLLKFLIKLLFRQTTVNQMAKMQEEIIKQYEKENYLKEAESLANGEEVAPRNNVISFEEFDRLYQNKNKELGYSNDYYENLRKDNVPFKFDKITKIMVVTTVVIVSVITLFTFIWGIL